jgi:hypothetical protein
MAYLEECAMLVPKDLQPALTALTAHDCKNCGYVHIEVEGW